MANSRVTRATSGLTRTPAPMLLGVTGHRGRDGDRSGTVDPCPASDMEGEPVTSSTCGSHGDMAEARSLTGLLDEAAAYRSSKDYADLLAFAVRMRRFGPYNAMLLHRQRPGLSFAASASAWRRQWKRTLKEDARPLVVLVRFGPVGFVYDIQDTEALPGAPELPRDAFAFPAVGNVSEAMLASVVKAIQLKGIRIIEIDTGDWHAGRIQRTGGAYAVKVNHNHPRETRLTTIAHELAHLQLGHLGADRKHKPRIPDRCAVRREVQEVEAESVAYIVCRRRGVRPDSASYLARFIKAGEPVSGTLDVERVMTAAGTVETAMFPPERDSRARRRQQQEGETRS